MNKEKIALLVDSGTDVPAQIMEQYGMYMLPLQIIYKDRTYTDKVDITAEEIYERLPQEIPSTSLPDGAAIGEIFDRIKADGYEKVFAVTISKNKVFFNVATLEYLQKGGRIGLVASILGNALKLNPIISCNEEGIYYTVAKSRGRKKSLDKTVDLIKQFIGDHRHVRLAVAQGDALQEAKEMKARLEAEFPKVKEILFGQISPALVVHTGPGLLGIGIQLLEE